jgi:hypothetical protein
MDFLKKIRAISQEFADYISAIAESELRFQGEHPIEHSRYNHVHLFGLERCARENPRIDLKLKMQAVEYIFARWQVRLKSYQPHTQQGFRMYLYEDFAPTISVVAETQFGFPYGRQPVFVGSPMEILEIYENRDWNDFLQPSEETAVLFAIEKSQGSIGTRAAQLIGLRAVELRKYIEWFELGYQVNVIRKQFHRRPAKFLSYEDRFARFKCYELRVNPA